MSSLLPLWCFLKKLAIQLSERCGAGMAGLLLSLSTSLGVAMACWERTEPRRSPAALPPLPSMTSLAAPSIERADRCLSEDDGDDWPPWSITRTAGSAATAAAMGAVAASANAAVAEAITIRRAFVMAYCCCSLLSIRLQMNELMRLWFPLRLWRCQ